MSEQDHREEEVARNPLPEPEPAENGAPAPVLPEPPAQELVSSQVEQPLKPAAEAADEPQAEKKEPKHEAEPPRAETLQAAPASQEKMESENNAEIANESSAKAEKEEEEDDPAKSQRKGSSEEVVESREEENENDTSQPATSGGKKCFNKLCSSKKIYKKIRSKVEVARYRFLCKNCYENYVGNNFCEYCEQIYSNFDEDEDQDKWVGCDQCDRWNHVECERKFRNPAYVFNRDAMDEPYECLNCSKKNRNGVGEGEVVKKKTQIEREVEPRPRAAPQNSQKMEIAKEQRISIFHKKPEVFPCLEPFLQSFNFRLWLNESVIREDMETLRSLARRPALDEEPKKGAKKIKTD